MQTVDLKATRREGTGKQVTRKLRAAGVIPAVLYGNKAEPESLQVDINDLHIIYRSYSGANFILNLAIEDQEPVMTIIRERQRHPVSGATLHLDFQRIDVAKAIMIEVPIHLTGEAPGVKDFGGTLEHLLRWAEVSCLPLEIPEEIVIDVSELGINDSIHVRDLARDGMEFLADEGRVVVAVTPPRIATTAEDEEAEGEEGETAEGEEGETTEGEETPSKDDAK